MTRLRRDILRGRVRPGERLPPERELAVELDTNRNTLREALRTLEAENLVRARQGDGTRVLDWRDHGEINLLPWFLVESTSIEERLDAVEALLRLREHLIDDVLARAAVRADEAALARVQAALDALAAAPPDDAVAADVELYRQLVLASRSLVLVWSFNTFARIFLDLGERFPHVWRIDARYLDGLARVVQRLRERRGDRAREEMRRVFADRNGLVAAHVVPSRRRKAARP